MFIIIRRTTNLSLLLLVVVLFSTSAGWSQTFQVIYNFGGGDAGPANPYAGVTLDGHGNLFGTTPEGGPYDFFCGWAGCGTVFELSPNGGGGWNEETIAEFDPPGHPTAPVVFDRLGNLYGFAYCLVDCVGEAPGEIFELILPEAPGQHRSYMPILMTAVVSRAPSPCAPSHLIRGIYSVPP